MYPNALELQNGSWVTYGPQVQLIEKPNDMPNYRVKVNWSTFAPMEGFFNDKDLELSNRVQRLGHSRKTITVKSSFSGTSRFMCAWDCRVFQHGVEIQSPVV